MVHQNGQVVTKDGEQAEIYVRGPSVMQWYLGNPQATAETIDGEDWLKTGDVAHQKDGLYYIIDRKKELMKVRGWQVSPAELEGQLALHPQIIEAAVIGVTTDEGDTELPRAYVVKMPGSTLTGMDVYRYMEENLAKYKAPDGGVRFVDAIPKNSIGKIVRRVVRDVAAAEEASHQDINILDASGRICTVSSTWHGEGRSWAGTISEMFASYPPTPMTDLSIVGEQDGNKATHDGTNVARREG